MSNLSRRAFFKGLIYATGIAASPLSLSNGVKTVGDYKLTSAWVPQKQTYLHTLQFNLNGNGWQVAVYSDNPEISEGMLIDMMKESQKVEIFKNG